MDKHEYGSHKKLFSSKICVKIFKLILRSLIVHVSITTHNNRSRFKDHHHLIKSRQVYNKSTFEFNITHKNRESEITVISHLLKKNCFEIFDIFHHRDAVIAQRFGGLALEYVIEWVVYRIWTLTEMRQILIKLIKVN